MKQAVTAVLFHPTTPRLILGVSRKDNSNDFGLPGGKVDLGETWEEALVREVREETGVVVKKFELLFEDVERYKEELYCTRAYLIKEVNSYDIRSSEKGVVSWVSWNKLTDNTSSCREYNSQLKNHIASMV